MSIIVEQYIILDIETNVIESLPNPELDELRYVGFRYKGKNICLHYTERERIQEILLFSKYIVGHNLKGYDIPILKRYGFYLNRGQIIVDTLEISINRLKSMLYLDLNQGDQSLDKLCERFELPVKKLNFDYSLLKKDILEGQEYLNLEQYLFADLECGEELFKFFYELFYSFKELVNEKNKENMSWLTSRSGTISYKILCNLANLEEEYNNEVEEEKNKFKGGFVLQPKFKYKEGNIQYRDASSLYPHIYMLGNLFSPVEKGKGWNGSGIYPNIYANEIDGIKGTYSKTPGKMENIFKFLFTERSKLNKEKKKYSKNSKEYIDLDRKQLPLKICMNSAYGACSNEKFKSIFNLTTASDCTSMARRTTKHAITVLEENGYDICMADTDSVVVYDPFNDDEKLNKIFDYIKKEQINSANIPIETHGFKLECKVKRMYFFKNDELDFNKKCYIYVTDKDEIIEKGIRIVRGDCSPIAVEVYEQFIKPMILKGGELNITFNNLKEWFSIIAKEKPDLLKIRYRLKPISSYKILDGKEEASGLHAQLSKKYGDGEFYFVINKRIGPGKGNHYCKIEDLQIKYGDHWIDQIKIESYIKDLKLFLIDGDRNKLK
jgi:DNA polymerase elongation subunit (family B)